MASPSPQDSPSSPPPPKSPDSPPPSSSGSPPPPPSDSSAPPPDQSSTPPPPQDSKNSPPPPPSSSNNSPPSPKSGGNNNNDKSPPPPPSSKNNRSPTPPRSLGPPPKDSSSKSSSDGGGSGTDVVPVVVGVAVVVLALLLIALIAFLCTCRKKRKRNQPTAAFYDEEPQGPKGPYYQSPNHSNWGGPQNGGDLPPPPGAHMRPPGWSQPPAPQSGAFLSSGEVSSNFSGPHGPPLPPPHPSVALGFTKNSFSYEELMAATEGFSHANLLGQGGFGYVHKGVLPNGKEIAVKSLKAGSGQGDREFQAEVEIISRVHHRHLVSLVGYCIAGGQRLLVYEYLPNYTLEHHLHGKGRPTMDWSTRLKIAVGSAKGLAYLHEDCHPRIIHRDIKASNILLDFNWEAKVSDFGLAKLSADNYTHVSTRVMGTFGYLAPEYASSGKLTEKSDVFSFGVMLLELISGRLPVDHNSDLEESLVDWARPLCQRAVEGGNFDGLVDPRLEGNYDPQEMARMVACAGAAVRHSGRRRPKMSQIVRALEGDASLEQLNEVVKAGQSSVFSPVSDSSEYDSGTYSADMKKFRKLALESQDYSSSEYGGYTSEYGLNPSTSSSEEMPRSGNAARTLN